jgi:3-oxoadipate enol-lactonase
MTEVQYVDSPAGRLAYRRRGTGDPLVLLHPLALSGLAWEPVLDRLSARYDVIAPDARGHGDSEWDGGPFTIEDLADDVVALLDGLGLESAHLVGMSMGGSTAVNAAGRHPARVRTLVMADSTAWYGEKAPVTWAERADGVLAKTRAEQVPFQVDRWFTERFRQAEPERVQQVVSIFLATDSPAHAQACHALGQMDSRKLLAGVTARTLAFAGDEDYATPPAMSEYVAEHVPGGVALILPGLRHLSLVECPALADLVSAHLDGAPLPPVTPQTWGLVGMAGTAAEGSTTK